jgi:hypothetical protein
MFPVEASPFDNPEQVRVRAAWKSDPNLFVEIEPLPISRQLDWMRSFAGSLGDEPTRAALERCLDQPKPVSEFTRTVRLMRLAGAWNEFRLRHVGAAIQEWADSNHLTVQIAAESTAPPTEQVRTEVAPSTRGAAPSTGDETVLRAKIHAAIDRMPLGELLRLSIPLEYIFDRRD